MQKSQLSSENRYEQAIHMSDHFLRICVRRMQMNLFTSTTKTYPPLVDATIIISCISRLLTLSKGNEDYYAVMKHIASVYLRNPKTKDPLVSTKVGEWRKLTRKTNGSCKDLYHSTIIWTHGINGIPPLYSGNIIK